MKRLLLLSLFACAPLACTAVSVSPPLSSKTPTAEAPPGTVAVTSGQFRRPFQVVGVVQMTQSGYRWMHEVEVVDDANPGSILYKLAHFANQKGANGIQFLELVDLDPQTPGEIAKKQFESAVRIADKAGSGDLDVGDVAQEGTETRWEVRGELVRFLD